MRLFSLIVTTSFLFVISSCGGGGGDSGGGNVPVTPLPPSVSLPTQPEITTAGQHRIELGPIAGATVRVLAPGGNTELFTGNTDASGYFRLNTGVVRSSWEKLSVRPEYVWVTATGGTDTDPNDDGIKEANESIPLTGELRGIVPIARLLNDSNIRVSLLSAVIADVLGNTTDLTEARITETAKQLGFPDIDKDGLVTVNDVLFYEMGSNSGLETELRPFYLNTVHGGDSARRQQFISTKLINFLPVRYTITQEGTRAAVRLYGLNPNNRVYVRGGWPDMDAATPMTPGVDTKYMLSIDQKLYFRECSSAMACSPTQVLLWTGSGENSFIAAPDGIVGNVYQDATYIERIRGELNRITTELQVAAEKVVAANAAAIATRQSVNAIKAEIDEIDRELATLGSQ